MNETHENEIVLVVAAHSDDETLGVGGTIARHIAVGDTVYVMSMTDGVGARADQSADMIMKRREASERAATILGFKWLDGGNFHDNAMDTVALLSISTEPACPSAGLITGISLSVRNACTL